MGKETKEVKQISGLAPGLKDFPAVVECVKWGEILVGVSTKLLKFATPEDDKKFAEQAKSWSVPENHASPAFASAYLQVRIEQRTTTTLREEFRELCADALISVLTSGGVDDIFAGSRAQTMIVATALRMASSEAATRIGSGFISAEVTRRPMCDSDIEVVLVDQKHRPSGLGQHA